MRDAAFDECPRRYDATRADPLPHPRLARRWPRHPRRNGHLVCDPVTDRPLHLRTDDGIDLEAILDEATPPSRGGIVVCHPHPEQGGTMRAPLIVAMARRIASRGYDALRFNFRGVGSSTGAHGGGIAEIDDVEAAVSWLERRPMPIAAIMGWSFGAATALRWQARTGSTLPYVGIAPPVASALSPPLPDATELAPAPRTIIVGDRDQLIDVEALIDYANGIGASVIRYATADHFFVLRHDRLADDAIDAIEP
jgi:uncharacterized protein